MDTLSQLNKVFGAHLRNSRKAARLTQEELAFRAGLDRTYISLLERGIKSPTLTTFFQLCRVLDLQPDIFIARIHAQLMRIEQEQTQKQNTDS
ncbi:MAG: helix-turn-helix domain-containing protein [Chloroflexota bacterium]|nr:helix-turn-helix domain-containing protein [Chloroflexota bacterium]